MPEHHDNTKPAQSGSYSIGKHGCIIYFPIEDPGYLKPFLALCLVTRPNGEIVAMIDERWGSLDNLAQ